MNISVQNPNFNMNGANTIKLVGGQKQEPINVGRLDPKKYDTFQLNDALRDLCQKLGDNDKDAAIYDPNNMPVKISGAGQCVFGCDCGSGHRYSCLSQGSQTITNVNNCFNALQKSLGDSIDKERGRLDEFKSYSEEKSYYLDLLDRVGYQHKGHCVHRGVTVTEDKYGFSAGKFVPEAEIKRALENVTEKIGKLVSPEKSMQDILSMPRSRYNFNAAAIVEASGLKGDCFEQITKDSIMFSYDGLTEKNFIEWTNEKINLLTEKSEGFKRAAEQFGDMINAVKPGAGQLLI